MATIRQVHIQHSKIVGHITRGIVERLEFLVIQREQTDIGIFGRNIVLSTVHWRLILFNTLSRYKSKRGL